MDAWKTTCQVWQRVRLGSQQEVPKTVGVAFVRIGASSGNPVSEGSGAYINLYDTCCLFLKALWFLDKVDLI